jgi:HlyD family secretion protein
MAEMALRKYEEGERVELEQDARLQLEKAKSVLTRSQDYQKDSEELYKQGYITRIDLENDRFKAYEAQIELKKAEVGLGVLEKYTIPMDLREKQSAVAEAEKELDRVKKSAAAAEAKADADVSGKKAELDLVGDKLAKLRDQKTKAKIYAPADGLVVYTRSDRWYRSDSEIETGAQVIERQLLIQLPDTTSMKVVIRVHEAQTEHLKVGLPARIEVEGVTGRQFTGKVNKIAVLADSQNRWLNPNLKQYETEVLLDGTVTDLKPGTTSRVQVELASLHNVLSVPVQAIFAKGGRYYVFTDANGSIRPVEVKMGLSSNEYVEIKEGVESGQFVRLAVTEEMKLLLPEGDDSPARAGAM